jgi:hypothetical protein
MKTKEEILQSHCQSMNTLFLDIQGRQFRERVFEAMEEYLYQQTAEKDRDIEVLKAEIKSTIDEKLK